MMQLKKILLEVLREQEELGSNEIIEFPNENFTVTVDRSRKRLIFAPQDHFSLPSSLRTTLTMLKQRFNVQKVNSLEDGDDTKSNDTDDPNLRGVFEIVFDPREDIEAVLDFIKNEVEIDSYGQEDNVET